MNDKKHYYEYLTSFVTENRRNLFDNILTNRTEHFTVVLENIYQKHNTSAVVRSCDIFGIQKVSVIEKNYSSYVSNQVAKGAQKWLDITKYRKEQDPTKACIGNLRKQGYQIIATSPHNESCYLEDFDISKKSAFVFGVEKEGVSNEVMEHADGFLKIPMVGFTESLNISVAVAIILQNLTTRLRNSDIDWQLSEEEKFNKKIQWMEKSIKSLNQIKDRYLIDFKKNN